MPNANVKLLIVDDEPSTRTSLSFIFAELGHSVRSAEDGFSALVKIRQEIPGILLSDLNMPSMSGFELLSVVRRRFPAIRVIAMSGAFSGDCVPLGVAADAFYEKGTNPGSLLRIVDAMTNREKPASLEHLRTLAPVWIPRNGHSSSGEAYVIVTCPECLRTFPGGPDAAPLSPIHETNCVHCASLIHYAIVQSTEPASVQECQRKPVAGMSASFLSVQFQPLNA
jgi:CheY-like chemotaxis protein